MEHQEHYESSNLSVNEKILTVSIAAYNVEKTIGRALESCLIDELGLIEVIVVDDGSVDSTASVVETYTNKYPDSIKLIRKENGGYGTTVNTSLENARGRYFKLLDGDDTFDRDALHELVDTLRCTKADLVVSPFIRVNYASGKRRLMRQLDVEAGLDIPCESLPHTEELDMHALTWKTEILRQSGIKLPSHVLYTDSMFVAIPLRYVRTVRITERPVYLYALGVEGQSVSWESLRAHYKDLGICMRAIAEVDAAMPSGDGWASDVVRGWLVTESCLLLRVLLSLKPSKNVWEQMKELLYYIKKIEGLDSDCRARSKSYIICSKTNRITYPFIATFYRLSERLRNT